MEFVMDEWQPIETAPKDRAILVYHFGYTIAHFNTAYGHWIGQGECTPDTLSLKQFPPTDWMPLPDPPKDQ